MSKQSAYELLQLAIKCFERGDYQGLIKWAKRAEVKARRDGETGYELWAIFQQTGGWGNIGDQQKALKAASRLMNRARQTKQEYWLIVGSKLFASRVAVIDLRNRWHEIRPLLLEGLQTARRLGNNYEEVDHLKALGQYAVVVGEEEQAYAWLQEALNAIEPNLERADFFRYAIYQALSKLVGNRGEYALAVYYADMSVEAAEERGNPDFVGDARLTLAEAEQARGELATALQIAEDVLAQARQRGWKSLELDAEYLRSEIKREQGQPEIAIPAARRALQLAQEMQGKEEQVECLLSLGQALQALGEQQEAFEVLRRARRLSQEHNYENHFNKAEELLASFE